VAEDFVREGKAREVLVSLMTELLALGKAMGIEYQEDMVRVNLDIIAGLNPKADTSMQRDIAAGHKSEFNGLVKEVIKMGDRYGVPMPTYKMLADEITV
jgi:2-dehydropantoate 2-reductase